MAQKRLQRLLRAAFVCALSHGAFAAEPQWVKARLGSFEAISDGGRHAAIQGLSQFEQFRFALGTIMGQPDLRLDPPLRIVVFRNAQELNSMGFTGIRPGRDRLMACVTAEGQLTPALVRELTQSLLQSNFSKMPPAAEAALETFFSTVQSNAVHVTWGAPPPQADRTREWGLLHRMITQPEFSGRAHIYLHNLASGMDSNAALRSLSEDPVKFNADTDQYYLAGVFNAVQAPNRPLNPERDFTTTVLTSDEGDLTRADLLTPGAAAIYQSLLKSEKHVAEDNEGLALLALRAGNNDQASTYMEAARRAGSHNPIALTAFAAIEKEPERAIAILKEALTADPKYAPAHWALGERIDDKPRRLAEWKQAVALAPQNWEWWSRYADLCIDQKQYAEASRAWVAAAQSAPDAAHREQFLSARGKISELRLDDEEAARRRDIAAKAAEIERLKAQARKDIADMEARVNTRPLTKEELAHSVDWADTHGGSTFTGSLVRVICAGKQMRLEVTDPTGQTEKLSVTDPGQLEMVGGTELACGIQKPRDVRITFKPAKDKSKGLLGEATSIEFR